MKTAEIPVVILAGGRGARFDHETQVRPKPMIEVAGRPMLQHIIDGFVVQGFREFIVPTGYLGRCIREHFESVGDDVVGCPLIGDIIYWWSYTIAEGKIRVKVVDTGPDSHTGERLYRVRPFINGRRFVLTYGDGLSDVDMTAVLAQHIKTGAGVTMTVVHPPGRFGVVKFCDEYLEQSGSPTLIGSFAEKPAYGWINGGFMVCEPEFVDRYIEGPDSNELERVALNELSADGGLHGFRHEGYWACIDTRRDLERVEDDVRRNGGLLPWLRRDAVG